ncbi:glycoside hydrolase family 19 protein [Hymenobacter sp. GOD-10R]|uniref:glycoside hydrolase family 19 protein n=1 Tax=Hymenobacter sp. GOD-10R TaxID=3093922 RepID=UPI002D79895F|nr:glycoside hydrolase family 19 protein [Hymenobacter sp. GOD-10R]WRQ26660.1 glycoside hydrolase family 19 protein [Hymenobacter sp. GOD-10R]
MLQLNKDAFYDAIRPRLFAGSIKAGQFAGLETITDYYAKRYTDKHWLAYLLATTHHETAKTWQPIDEHGSDKYFFEMYDKAGKRPHVAADLGNVMPGDGVRYHGRGYVQLTGRANYAAFSKVLTLDLVSHPEKAKEPATAAKILVEGSVRGLFTGKKLADYFVGVREDQRNARRIINGLDKAELIAGYYNAFKDALHPSLLTV